jgi:hypothetical protein
MEVLEEQLDLQLLTRMVSKKNSMITVLFLINDSIITIKCYFDYLINDLFLLINHIVVSPKNSTSSPRVLIKIAKHIVLFYYFLRDKIAD